MLEINDGDVNGTLFFYINQAARPIKRRKLFCDRTDNFSNIFLLWEWTLTYCMMSKVISESHFSSKVIVRTDRHTCLTDCSTWITKVGGINIPQQRALIFNLVDQNTKVAEQCIFSWNRNRIWEMPDFCDHIHHSGQSCLVGICLLWDHVVRSAAAVGEQRL